MAEFLKRWGGPAAMLGGALWVVYFVLFAAFSASQGKSITMVEAATSQTAPLAALYLGAIGFLGVAMWGLRARLDGWHPILGYIGAIPAISAIVLALVGLARLITTLGEGNPLGNLAGFGVLSTSVGAIVLGIATLRARTLPGRMRFVPLILGVLTFPSIIGIGMLGAFVPAYITDELPFALLGLTWFAIGRAMLIPATREVGPQFAPAAEVA